MLPNLDIKELASLIVAAIEDSGVDFFPLVVDWERFCKKEKNIKKMGPLKDHQ